MVSFCVWSEEKDAVVLDNDFAECMLMGMFAYACNLSMVSFAAEASMLFDHHSASLECFLPDLMLQCIGVG